VSLVMAFFFVFTIYGIYGMFSVREFPIHVAIVFLILAIFFVIGYDFFHSRLARKSTALLVGFLVAFCLTIVILAIIEFGFMVYDGTVWDLGWENFIIAIAFCLILSVVILKYAENY
jgi:hypothetical protein